MCFQQFEKQNWFYSVIRHDWRGTSVSHTWERLNGVKECDYSSGNVQPAVNKPVAPLSFISN